MALAIPALVWLLHKQRLQQQVITEQSPFFAEDLRFPLSSPIEPVSGLDPQRVALGRQLFFDPRLSGDSSISCSSCHRFELGGADGLPVSIGVGGARGEVNAPSIFNSGLAFAQFWDARADNLAEQMHGPIHNPVEMNSSWAEILPRLQADRQLRKHFNAAYATGLTQDNLIDAIVSFEMSLTTPDSPFDQYLRGDKSALSDSQKKGYQSFRDYGCISCHQGVLLGGNMLQKFGIMGNYFANRELTKADLGRYNVTGRDEDLHVFKVPGLRNVALTAPYFHDGSINNLEIAVSIMASYQLGRQLPSEDLQNIVAFLHSLNGSLPDTGAMP